MIRTVDNQEATVQVGKNVPIIYGFTTTATGSLAPICATTVPESSST